MITNIPRESWAFNKDDTLPVDGVKNGQAAMNMDDSSVWMFDEAEQKWKPQNK